MNEYRIYVEGGSKGAGARYLRQGFLAFFEALIPAISRRKSSLRIEPSGSRNQTYKNFVRAVSQHSPATCFLLVDSEGPISKDVLPWQYLKERKVDQWNQPNAVSDNQCHLMVQLMESWFLADANALEEYYGQGFQKSALPKSNDIETVDKVTIIASLKSAVRNTKKREYHKTRHAPDLLKAIKPEVVRSKARHCDRLFKTLEQLLKEPD